MALGGHLLRELNGMVPLGRANPAASVTVDVTLKLHHTDELNALLQAQQDPHSSRYHQWLIPSEFDARFGPTAEDEATVANWFSAQGFTVIGSSLSGRYVRASATVAMAEHAFGTSIMSFGNGASYANVTAPSVPAQIAQVIGSINGLSNFIHARAANGRRRQISRLVPGSATDLEYGPLLPGDTRGFLSLAAMIDPTARDSALAPPLLRASSGPIATPEFEGIGFGPQDLYSFYDETPLLAKATGGGGGCIAIVSDSNVLDTANTGTGSFSAAFGLPSPSITKVMVNGTDPGTNDDEDEALLDLQWSHAAAPGAAQRLYLGDGSQNTPNGPIVHAIQRAITDDFCQVISVSFELCGAPDSFFTGTLTPFYTQAMMQGQSIFVEAGDQGAAGLIFDSTAMACVPTTTRSVNEMGADPNVTMVGGTSFNPNYNSNGDNTGFVAEEAWNDSSLGDGATGGGASAIYVKPSYQTPGTPVDGKRDVPDISMVASDNTPGVFWVTDDGGNPSLGCCIGGTGLSAPLWAGLAKVIVQLKGEKLGPINPTLYQMARAGLTAHGFRDVLTGNNDFLCPGTGCVTGFNAGSGYDQTTGWGTVDMTAFANAFIAAPTPSSTPTRTPTPKPTASSTRTPTGTPTKTPTPARTPTVKPSSTPSRSPTGTADADRQAYGECEQDSDWHANQDTDCQAHAKCEQDSDWHANQDADRQGHRESKQDSDRYANQDADRQGHRERK
ncbi:MAG: protease pro-enzyme activation domain-containing protein [Candidatus Binataceae bacterium]